ncbi:MULTISPECIES: type II 3-dehydroquinate dehydratase [Chitinibacter]|uniref:type II 3-dehydroquinate dehydratase n=1 Tax=Chitinibacter TaxID=230666 RepID=UPI0003FC34BF|nr:MULTISPECIES: type II 3-dehydroquinate dehydratase [Chitinibacter]
MSASDKILVLHGPNLNLLGLREPQHYGSQTLAQINAQLVALGTEHGIEVETFQSNREYELIERIHACLDDGTRYIVINPAAFTHTSIALRDALSGVKIPFVEVHLSNIHARDAFRHKSYFSDLAAGVICGLGPQGYQFGLHFAISKLKTQ